MAKETYDFLLRFDIGDKKEAALYRAIHEAASDNGRSINKEILQTLKGAYVGGKK